MNKTFGMLFGLIGTITAAFIVLGLVFDKSENEKQQGLTDNYDVSIDGRIAYVKYDKGKAGIYLTNGAGEPIVQLPVEQTILDINFSKDGKTLAYVVSDKVMDAESGSAVHLVNIETLEDQIAFSSKSIITELAFDPKDPDQLFYLQAGVFTNYSPITGPRPHDFDVHSYDLAEKKHTQYTELKKYSMRSLQVSASDETVFVQMDDDENAQTADDIFESRQRIFQIPLDAPDEKSIISNPAGQEDIYDFLLLPERDELIYQAVGGTGADGVFEYELFSFNWKTYETKQLTNLKEYTAKPILSPDNKIYFLLDREFAGRQPDYHIYQMNVDGTDIKEIKW